ncbi:hypothetical protein BLOT_014837 [Blomia tropicalis]|nr:hypothetical protein BLOT_014837 [Blomia tropicalis]
MQIESNKSNKRRHQRGHKFRVKVWSGPFWLDRPPPHHLKHSHPNTWVSNVSISISRVNEEKSTMEPNGREKERKRKIH